MKLPTLFQFLLFSWITFHEAAGRSMKPTSSGPLLKNFKDLSSKVDEMGESPVFEFGKVMKSVIDEYVDSRDISIVTNFSNLSIQYLKINL
jgi:hypothetical protein